jgi:hypothetical protein
MAVDFAFRRKAVKSLTSAKGVYVLADLDNTPIYVGQSRDGIRQRVQRHLTSARSDVIANRQIDVWEIAFVWQYPVEGIEAIDAIEAVLVHEFNPRSSLMNGTIPPRPRKQSRVPQPTKVVQVMSDKEIAERKDPEQRLPRQASHYAQLVGHFLAVKNSDEIARAMDAHFERLQKYHKKMLKTAQHEDGE